MSALAVIGAAQAPTTPQREKATASEVSAWLARGYLLVASSPGPSAATWPVTLAWAYEDLATARTTYGTESAKYKEAARQCAERLAPVIEQLVRLAVDQNAVSSSSSPEVAKP